MGDIATEARAFVLGLLPEPLAQQIEIVTTVGDLLTQLSEAERKAEGVRIRLNALYSVGALSPLDQLNYNRLRRAIYRAQLELRSEITERLPDVVVEQLPFPKMMPPLGVAVATAGGGIASGVSGSRRRMLSAVPAAAAAPAAPLAAAPWMWAVVVVAILVALGLLVVIAVAIATSAAAAATVGIASEYAELAEQMTETREAVYRQCVAEGGTPADCAEVARTLVPTPAEQLPDIPNPLDGMAASFKWGAVGIGLLLVGYFGIKLFGGKKS